MDDSEWRRTGIIIRGMREGTLYQMTSQSEIDEELDNFYGIACGKVYGMRKDTDKIIDDILCDPKIHDLEVDSKIRELRKFDVYTQWRDELLDRLIDEAARAFAKDAVIITLDAPFFIKYRRDVYIKGAKNNPFLYYRFWPVSEGFLQYFRKELRRRRQKLIEEID
jgi:hypothetical protein